MAQQKFRRLRLALVRACFAVIVCLAGLPAWADPLYTVTYLGAASPSAAYLGGQAATDPSGNYLGALSASQQAAFQAGSFDVYAHPATGWAVASQQNPDASNIDNDVSNPSTPAMVTSNNVGGYAGTDNVTYSAIGVQQMVITFTADPHVVASNDYSPYSWAEAGQQSNGFLNLVSPTVALEHIAFNVSVAGINDQGNLAINITTYANGPAPGYQAIAIQSPHLMIGSGDTALGSLGGADGMANALNNSNEVVGWSQTASGAEHAFLYANGAMQDLNLLIPPASGITLVSAVGVDAAGDIVAYGTNASGQMLEYYLTPAEVPAPEPGTLAIWGLVSAIIGAKFSLRTRKLIARRRAAFKDQCQA